MTKIENLQGFCYPLTPGGKSSIVGDYPWHYSAEFFFVVYESDPDVIAKYLPEPLKPGAYPNRVSMSFSRWWSLWDNQLDMAYVNPERTQYTEADIWVGSEYKGKQMQTCLYAWVDNDFTMLRGHFMGYPKKLGYTALTDYHQLNPKMEPIQIGSKIKGFTSAHGERIAEGTLKITEKINYEDLPNPMAIPIGNIRHFPSIVPGAPPSVHELVINESENHQVGDVWKGDASLILSQSEICEHSELVVKDIIGGYYYTAGFSGKGGKVLHSWV